MIGHIGPPDPFPAGELLLIIVHAPELLVFHKLPLLLPPLLLVTVVVDVADVCPSAAIMLLLLLLLLLILLLLLGLPTTGENALGTKAWELYPEVCAREDDARGVVLGVPI